MNETQKALKELMDKYTEYSEMWRRTHGTMNGFDDWFTAQVFGSNA